MKDIIEIPFGAHDSELKGFEYTIPEGFEAEIKDGKVIVRQKEREDDRIRKYILKACKETIEADDRGLELSMDTTKKLYAYLEKQKEQHKGLHKNSLRYVNNPMKWMEEDDAEREHKPAQTVDEKEYIRTIKSIIADFIRDKQPEDVALYQKIYDWLDGRHIEQQSAESVADVKITTSDSSADGKELLYVCNKSYKIGYRDGVNSVKPAEWSEEDERLLTKLMAFVDIESFDRECNGQDVIDWLKSLRPKPHWKPSEYTLSLVKKIADGIWNASAGKLVLCRKEDNTFTYASPLDMEILEYDTVDWSAFRREAAKDILAHMVIDERTSYSIPYETLVKNAIKLTDELIKQLRDDTED